jgi:hypothetical protein
MCVIIENVLDCILDLVTIYTHDSKLQLITALSLIATLYKSLQQTPSLYQPLPGNGF